MRLAMASISKLRRTYLPPETITGAEQSCSNPALGTLVASLEFAIAVARSAPTLVLIVNKSVEPTEQELDAHSFYCADLAFTLAPPEPGSVLAFVLSPYRTSQERIPATSQ